MTAPCPFPGELDDNIDDEDICPTAILLDDVDTNDGWLPCERPRAHDGNHCAHLPLASYDDHGDPIPVVLILWSPADTDEDDYADG